MQLILWIGFSVVVAFFLRDRLHVFLIVVLSVWLLIPAVAGSLITGIASGPVAFHPASWLVFMAVPVQILHKPARLGRAVAQHILIFLVMALTLSVAFLSNRYSSSGGGTVLLMDIILVPCVVFFIACVVMSERPDGLILIRNALLAMAAFECVVAVIQWVAGSVLLYSAQYAKQYWFDETKFDRWMGTTDHPLVLSLFLCICVPMVAGLTKAWIQIPLLALFVIGAIITQSRTGLFVVGLGLAFVLLTTRIGIAAKAISLTVMAVAGYFIWTSPLVEGVLSRLDNDTGSTEARGDALGWFLDHWANYTFTGGGIGSSYRIAELAGLITSFESSVIMYAVDIGVVFSLLYFGSQLVTVLRAFRRPGLPGLFFAGLSAIVIPQTFSGLAIRSMSGVLVWLIFAMCATVTVRAREARDAERQETADLVTHRKRASVNHVQTKGGRAPVGLRGSAR